MKPIILYRNDVDWRQEEQSARKYFECVDSTKGAVIGWKKQITVSQNCYR